VKIIEAIQQNSSVTAVELSQHFGISLRAVEKTACEAEAKR